MTTDSLEAERDDADEDTWMEGSDDGEDGESSAISSSLNSAIVALPGSIATHTSMALPREHSYLNESHPLMPDESRFKRPRRDSDDNDARHDKGKDKDSNKHRNRNRTINELAVLELHGVVLFPGCTIPIKLRNQSMIRYLGRQIQKCRTDPVAQPEVLLGILPYEPQPPPPPEPQQRREPMARRSTRRQRFSLGNGETAPTASSYRIRQSLTRLRDQFQYFDPDDDNDDDDDDNRILSLFGETDESTQNNRPEPRRSQPQQPPSHPLVGRIGTIATVRHTHERTVTNFASGSSSVWGDYEASPELVFTAVGTGRFKILSCVSDRDDLFCVTELVEAKIPRPPWSNRLLPVRYDACDSFSDESLTATEGTAVRSRSNKMPRQANRVAWNLSLLTPLPYSVYQKTLPWSLVDKIATALRTHSGASGNPNTNLPSLGDDSIITNRSKLEPRAFSYWMANNAPFSENEKLKLLKMDSVLERLLYIWRAVHKLITTSNNAFVCCNRCGVALSRVSEIFCVQGAEGTTSAYVNGHGCIHQITTLRTVIREDSRITFVDSPSTENTYFPGYSWWISCCSRCGSMLGWKFQKVKNHTRRGNNHNDDDTDDTEEELTDDDDDDDETESNTRRNKNIVDPDTCERPPFFYGFMSSNVKTRHSLSRFERP